MVRRGEIARWPWGPDRVGAPFAIERAAIPGGANNGSAKNGGSIHDWAVRRVETARIGLKRTPGSRLAPHRAQNGARPGFRAILHEECALGALNGLFGFPGRSVRIRGHAPAQGATQVPWRRSALSVARADLPPGWSLPTSPSPPKPHTCRNRPVCSSRVPSRRVWLGLASGQGILNVYLTGGGWNAILLYQDGRCLPPPPPNPMARGRPVRGPSALGESGWASRVDRASKICTRGTGTRFRHFGGPYRISSCSIRSPMGPRRPRPHGEVGGVLISILG